jgi:phage FluMu protein Com
MVMLGMSSTDILCEFCEVIVVEYYHEGYKGKRGKCPKCHVDFPLD